MSDRTEERGSQAAGDASIDSTKPASTTGDSQTPAKKKRKRSVPLTAQADTVEADASESSSPDVQRELAELERDHAHYDRAQGEKPAAAAALPKLKQERLGARQVLAQEVRLCQKGLSLVRGGEVLVSQTRSRNVVQTARKMKAQATPRLIGHNGPLFEQMLRALENYERIDADCTRLQAQCSNAVAHARWAKRMLELSLSATRATLQLEQVAKEKAKLIASMKKAGGKLKIA